VVYEGIDAVKVRKHLIEFLEQVTPVAKRLSVKLTLHPDDPPRPLFGLPRVASTEEDYAALFAAVPSEAEWHVLLHRQSRRAGGQRSSSHGPPLRITHSLCSSPGDPKRS
jgi:hypothetical protein